MPAVLLNPWTLAAIGGLAVSLGFFADKTGEGIESVSNAALKVGVGALAGYIVLKKAKVI